MSEGVRVSHLPSLPASPTLRLSAEICYDKAAVHEQGFVWWACEGGQGVLGSWSGTSFCCCWCCQLVMSPLPSAVVWGFSQGVHIRQGRVCVHECVWGGALPRHSAV